MHMPNCSWLLLRYFLLTQCHKIPLVGSERFPFCLYENLKGITTSPCEPGTNCMSLSWQPHCPPMLSATQLSDTRCIHLCTV